MFYRSVVTVKFILASQSTEKKMEYAEAEHCRQIALSKRTNTRALARDTMRNELAPVVKKLSELLDFETQLEQNKHLFQSELKQAQNAKKELKKKVREEARKAREEARKVREEEKKKVRENFLKEILERCACG